LAAARTATGGASISASLVAMMAAMSLQRGIKPLVWASMYTARLLGSSASS
jgi:hypothetical protein